MALYLTSNSLGFCLIYDTVDLNSIHPKHIDFNYFLVNQVKQEVAFSHDSAPGANKISVGRGKSN